MKKCPNKPIVHRFPEFEHFGTRITKPIPLDSFQFYLWETALNCDSSNRNKTTPRNGKACKFTKITRIEIWQKTKMRISQELLIRLVGYFASFQCLWVPHPLRNQPRQPLPTKVAQVASSLTPLQLISSCFNKSIFFRALWRDECLRLLSQRFQVSYHHKRKSLWKTNLEWVFNSL